MKLADNKATLSFSNGSPSVDLPVYQGSIGPDVIDIRKLYAQTGMFTYDPGFLSTAATQSAITYIDGDKGELLYRGYPIEQLAENCDFLETCHLLLYGDLPNPAQKADRPPTRPVSTAMGCASRRKPRRKNCICSLTMVWLVTRLVKSFFWASLGRFPYSSRWQVSRKSQFTASCSMG